MQFTTQQPAYFIIICLLVAAGLTWLLYSRNTFPDEQNKNRRPWWYWLITVCRFVLLFVLCFLLLEPLLRAFTRYEEKPVVVIALDGSASVTACRDSAFYRKELPAYLQKLGKDLGTDYEVNYFTFGHGSKEGIDAAFNEKQSNLSGFFDELYNRYDKQNLGAVLIATDGIYNEGQNPQNLTTRLHAPVMSIALGDTNLQRDVKVSRVHHNDLAYLGNTFPIQVEGEADNCNKENLRLTVSKNGKTLYSKELPTTSDRQFFRENITLDASERGLQHYVVALSRVEREVSYANNQYDIFIEVLDGRQKILLLAQCPHPDLGAIRSSLEDNQNYEAELKLIEDADTIKPEAYSLIILHQLPGGNYNIQPLIDQARNKQVPLLFILGNQSNLGLYNMSEAGYTIQGNRSNNNEATATVDAGFNLFTVDEAFMQNVASFPPLKVPFGNYAAKGENEVLLKQQVGNVATNFPLISFNKNNVSKSGTVFGEGLWRWRLSDFQQHGNHDVFNELLSKTVQYLASRDDKRAFRVRTSQRSFFENERVAFEAELYNKSYELINTPDVQLRISNSSNKAFDYSFSRSGNSYQLDAGLMPPGQYTFNATVSFDGKTEKLSGHFTVKPLAIELLNTRADHKLLTEIAEASKGAVFYPRNTDGIEKFIRSHEHIKPVVYRNEEVIDLVNLKWLFAALLFLLALEWFVRKYQGAY